MLAVSFKMEERNFNRILKTDIIILTSSVVTKNDWPIHNVLVTSLAKPA